MTADYFGPDERQLRVIDVLQNLSPKLSGVYRIALSTLAKEPVPGCEDARISIFCHCVRELMMGLPAVVSNITIPRPTPSSSTLLLRLPGLLAAHPDADLGLDQDLVPVPRAVARVLMSLVSTATQEQGRNRANTAALVTGGLDGDHPLIGQWMSAYQWFVSWAHLDRNNGRERPLPSDEALLEKLRVVEDVIEVRGAYFFENLNALDELLAEINGDDEEGV